MWDHAPERWSEGVVLGNGRVGAVVWGDGHPLAITVDTTAGWDGTWSPPDPELHDFERFRAVLTGADPDAFGPDWPLHTPGFGRPQPSRVPPARVELRWPVPPRWQSAELDLDTGRCEITFHTGAIAICVLPDDVVLVEGDGPAPEVAVRAFRDAGAPAWFDERGLSPSSERTADDTVILRQELTARDPVTIAWRIRTTTAGGWALSIGVTVGPPDDDAAVRALDAPAPASARSNDRDAPWLAVPDRQLQDLWDFEHYKLDAVTRADADAIALQGPWSPDGIAPPWNGDYHWNVNVQMSYWPVPTLGRFDLYEPLWTLVERSLPAWRAFARDYFGIDGAFVPHATDDCGRAQFDWAIPSFGLGNGAWLAHVLWQQWTYTADEAVLRRLEPFLRSLANVLVPLLEPAGGGALHLPFSYAPEFPTGSAAPWGPDATHDLALLAWLLDAIVEAAAVTHTDTDDLRGIRARLASPSTDESTGPLGAFGAARHGGFRVRADLPLDRSHRHHSHLMPIHPLRQVEADGADSELVAESVRNLVFRGSGEWVGFSYPWAAAIAAAAGEGALAWGWLRDYADRWVTAGGFSVQAPAYGADATIWNGVARFMPQWATLEAGFGFMAALQDMLLQSHGGVLRLFPALPGAWRWAGFHGLHAEGGVVVDATYRDGEVVHARLGAGNDRSVTIAWPDGMRQTLDLVGGRPVELGDRSAEMAAPPAAPPEARHLIGTPRAW